MTAADIELLREFVTDEAASLAQKRQGKFWPQNHHRLRPLLPKVAKLLEPSDYEDFLFHLMRVTGGVPAIVQKDVPILLSAYRRLIPYLDLGGIVQMARRHEMLFLFGFDDNGALPDGMLTSAQDLKARLRLLAQIGAYTTQPAQRDKKARFVPFTGEASRLLQTMRHLGYRHDRRYGDDLYDITRLTFWGMVFTILLAPQTRADLLADLIGDEYHLIRRDEQLAMLHRYVACVSSDAPIDDQRFHDLARHLASI